jgi:hypothetical protein
VNVFRNIEEGWRVCFTDGVHNPVGKVGVIRVICRGGGVGIKGIREVIKGGSARCSGV